MIQEEHQLLKFHKDFEYKAEGLNLYVLLYVYIFLSNECCSNDLLMMLINTWVLELVRQVRHLPDQ